MKNIDLAPLYEAIEKHHLMDVWRGSVLSAFDSPEEHAEKKLGVVKQSFTRMMVSPKSDGSTNFQLWAINTALGLKVTHGYSAQAIGKQHWQPWGVDSKKRKKNTKLKRSQ
ncbi:hypothetical protein L4C54_03745 [Vibrio lamellibrachiae]|uniref:hypothetical protein n=1 Tax=Vibrio lamellibrachiae TaxID=2910253 RepID=UPI003D13B840